jgi:hypothetical protein
MNNIAAHFITAFLDLHLKGEAGKARYLTPEFAGFAPGSARGLVLEGKMGRIAHPTSRRGP